MKILLIKAMAEHHLYSQFAAALRDALQELGHEAAISDQSAQVSNGAAATGPLFAELQASRPEAVISFSSFFGSVTLDTGVSMFDALGVKFLGWQLDHPIYAPQSLSRALQNRFAVYSNRNHLRYALATKLPGRGVTMLPGGAPPAAPPKPYEARKWPVLVAATYRGEPQRLWEQLEDSPGKRLLTGVIDRLLADREASLLDAFNDTSAKLKLGARLGHDPAFDEQMRNFLCEPLTYVRNRDRIDIIRALADAGLPLTICGSGWDAMLGDRPNVTLIGSVASDEISALYGDARTVINLNAGNGASERAIQAAFAGAAVVSDFSQSLDALLGGGEGVAFFNRAKPETAARLAAGLIEGGRGEAMGARGHERAVRSALWRHRAEQLVAFLQVPA
jgi:hypothetical protein